MNTNTKDFPMTCIPPAETLLPTRLAEDWLPIPEPDCTRLEGLCFDGPDTLYFVDIDHDILYQVDMPTATLSVVLKAPGTEFSAVKVRSDGRLFLCCLNPTFGMLLVDEDHKGYQPLPALKGYVIDDMAFDTKGGFYFTQLLGEWHAPVGGVYYVSPDLSTVTPVVTGLASPNGVALSKDGRVLWVTETTGGRLLRFELDASGLQVAPYGSYPSYHFVGKPGPDSCCMDAEDNVYVALYQQGRYMVFQKDGYPIGQVLLPGREQGRNLFSTHAKVRPGTRELYMTGSSRFAGGGAHIFRSEAFALSDQP